MSNRLSSILGAGLLTMFLTTAAPAQVEFGLDGVFGRQISGDDKHTLVSLPTGTFSNALVTSLSKSFRVGFFVSPTISIEPSFAFFILDEEGADNAVRVLGLGLAALIHLSSDPTAAQFYVRPYVGMDNAKSGSNDARSQFSVGGGVGVKLPVVEHFKFRMEAGYVHGFENTGDGIPSQDVIAVLLGFSVII